jgi:hypothetical protein
VEGFLPRGYLVILAGDPKIGKTSLATAIAASVAAGHPFAGMATTQSPVLWLSLEEGPAERHSILSGLSLPSPAEVLDSLDDPSAEAPGILPLLTCYEQIAIDTEDGISVLSHWTNRTNASLIVVDPLHGAHSGRSLQDGWAARKTLRRLKAFCTESNVTALILHHLANRGGKARVAENAQLSATAGMFMILTSLPTPLPTPLPCFSGNGGGAGGGGRILTLETRGRGSFANRIWTFQSNDPLHYETIDPPTPKPTVKPEPIGRQTERRILDTLEGRGMLSISQLAQALQANPHTVRSAVDRLLARGELRVALIGSGTRYFALPEIGGKNAS